ncbi:MAG TPA: hypothetical protein VK457_10030 [Chloroflexota bacterium]|nr:hypothetical protein [Chloroflexota bacterium]
MLIATSGSRTPREWTGLTAIWFDVALINNDFVADALDCEMSMSGFSPPFDGLQTGKLAVNTRADTMLKQLAAARADYSFDRELRRFVAPAVGDRRLRPAQAHRLAVLGQCTTSSSGDTVIPA